MSVKAKYPMLAGIVSLFGLALASPALQAQVSSSKAAQLGGKKYTCMGALKTGTKDGVAKYSGKWLKKFPGVTQDQGYPGNPYADEKPLFTITADNMSKYADHLTAGQKKLLKEYPGAFKMPVYPSHRDFRFPDYVCKTLRKNAANAKLVHGGLGITGKSGAPPFPFPKNGQQAIWDVINPVRSWTSDVTYMTGDVFGNGNITWGKVHFMTMNPGNKPDQRLSYQNKINAYFYRKVYKPASQFGRITVGYQPNDFSHDATQAWLYLPGIRRVRKAPEIGFDYPVPPNGLRTVSDDYGFNGSPAHYNWKLLGKKEIYVPYNNFKVNKPGISYSDLLQPKAVNPKYMRYELHRVWVIEGDLKKGIRDIYGKRLIYADEDSWLSLTADNYDNRGNLYRVTVISYFYSQASGTYFRGTSIYHDLHKDAYEATYLPPKDKDKWWRINVPLRKSQFSPQAAASQGH